MALMPKIAIVSSQESGEEGPRLLDFLTLSSALFFLGNHSLAVVLSQP